MPSPLPVKSFFSYQLSVIGYQLSLFILFGLGISTTDQGNDRIDEEACLAFNWYFEK